MNEELQTAVSSLINKALDGVDATTGFLQAEIPEYLYQLLLWYGVKSFVLGGLYLAISAIWIYFGVIKPVKMISKGLSKGEENFFVTTSYNRGFETSGAEIALFANIFLIIPIVASISHLMTGVQIWIAPKVWLFEYASSLVK